MQKLDMKTPDITAQNIDKIAQLFPNCLTETKDDNGKITKAIDFDLLRQELSGSIVDGPKERYQMTWPGKREALVQANTPIDKTLRPCREESVDFDTTKNLYIEGDNLEALKLLQESYLGKVKMIYIDPPYNTGKDFVYKDNFKRSEEEELEASGQRDEEGGRLVANTESNGRFHSDWLSMMYPRLRKARDLLKEDGVLFVSIDDGESDNLRKICDEVFGEFNFITQICREAIKGGSVSKFLRVTHDYVFVYAKNIEYVEFSGYEKEEINLDQKDENGAFTRGRELNKWGAGSRREDSPSMWFPIKGPNGVEVYPIRNDGSEGRWRLGKVKMQKLVENGDIIFEKRDNGTYIAYEKIRERKTGIKQFTSIFKDQYINAKGTERIKALFNIERSYFDYAKPIDLMYDLLVFANPDDSDIVLDFFSGSAATADAVMKFNNDFQKQVNFIMVQLPEETDEKSEAYKAGYKTISEIGKERIRRAGIKIKEENADKDGIENLDIGFRVLKVDSSNMKDVYFTPDAVNQSQLPGMENNIKEDRSAEDLLFGVLLDWGVDLTLPITRETIMGKEVFFVDEDTLAACFEDGIDEAFVKELAKREVMRVVFKDSGFSSDAMKNNVDQIFAQLSPDTEVRAL